MIDLAAAKSRVTWEHYRALRARGVPHEALVGFHPYLDVGAGWDVDWLFGIVTIQGRDVVVCEYGSTLPDYLPTAVTQTLTEVEFVVD